MIRRVIIAAVMLAAGMAGAQMIMGPPTQWTAYQQSSAWSPTSIANLAGWWDFSDSANRTVVGTGISQVNDKSGNSRHATQATTNARPTLVTAAVNGRDVALFDGGDAMNLASSIASGTYTMFAVVRRRATTDAVFPLAKNATDGAYAFLIRTSDNGRFVATHDGYVQFGTTTTTGDFVIASSSTNGARSSVKAYTDGAELSATANAAVTYSQNFDRIGNRGTLWHIGYIGEVLVWTRVLTAAERGTVTTNLMTRWGCCD